MDGRFHPAPIFAGADDRWARSTPAATGLARASGLGVAVMLHIIVGVQLVAIPGRPPAPTLPVDIVLAEIAQTASPADAAPEPTSPDFGSPPPPADAAAAIAPPTDVPAAIPRAPAARPASRPPAARPTAASPPAAPAEARAQAPPASSPELIAAYRYSLLAHLERHRQYPYGARLRREEGIAAVRFTVDRGGRLLALAISTGSGHAALDDEALATLRRAEPLPPLPPEITAAQLEFVLPLRFNLK